MNSGLLLIGRVLLALVFLGSAFDKITHFEGNQEFMAANGMGSTAPLLVCAILLELGGGLSVVGGWHTRIGVALLVVFLITATCIFHLDLGSQEQLIHFMKNLSILGGLLLVAGAGPGSISIDHRRRRSS